MTDTWQAFKTDLRFIKQCSDCGWQLPRFDCPHDGCNGVALHVLNPLATDQKTVAERCARTCLCGRISGGDCVSCKDYQSNRA